jgi:hypothetical protein
VIERHGAHRRADAGAHDDVAQASRSSQRSRPNTRSLIAVQHQVPDVDIAAGQKTGKVGIGAEDEQLAGVFQEQRDADGGDEHVSFDRRGAGGRPALDDHAEQAQTPWKP